MKRIVLMAMVLAGGCETVDLGEAPVAPGACRPSPEYFRDVIWPEYLAPNNPDTTCVAEGACHRADGRSSLRLDHEDPIDFNSNYEVVTKFLTCGNAEASSLLTKPLAGIDAHGGGDLFDEGAAEYATFLAWFSAP